MKTPIKLIILIFISVMIFSSGCKKEDSAGQAPALTLQVNRFIKDAMDEYYLYKNKMPNIDYRYELDSKEYFKKLLYKDDKWSFITDDIQSLENSFKGKEKTFGWSLAFGKFTGSEKVFGLVEFVYPNSPADAAGMKRGDMIFKMNNADISVANYTDLLNADQVSVSYGNYTTGTGNIQNVKTAQLTSEIMELDPVQNSRIIEEGGHKIGYFLYTQFINEYTSSLDTLFQNFIAEGVTDVIVDLRYNPGGRIYSAQYLSSELAPSANVSNNDILVYLQWNDDLQDYYEQNAVVNQLEFRMFNTVPFKMNLDKIYFLTGFGTASASELTIIGLMPYMDVITVGDTTYGKYTASQTYRPEDIYEFEPESYYKDIDNWGVQPIIARYKNTENFTDFIYGLYPTIPVHDDITAGVPLGDTEDPVINAAIEDITGSAVVAKKSSAIAPYQLFDRGFSKYDRNKRELPLDRN